MTELELRPCPFCGCEPNWHTIRMSIDSPRHCRYFVSCDGDICLCPSTTDFNEKQDAADMWNMRDD